MEMTEDEQELFDERVAIMVIDGKVPEDNAIAYVKRHFEEIMKKIKINKKNY